MVLYLNDDEWRDRHNQRVTEMEKELGEGGWMKQIYGEYTQGEFGYLFTRFLLDDGEHCKTVATRNSDFNPWLDREKR